jgi:hypothetical protein
MRRHNGRGLAIPMLNVLSDHRSIGRQMMRRAHRWLALCALAPICGAAILATVNAPLLCRNLMATPDWSGGWLDDLLDRHWCEREYGSVRAVWVYSNPMIDVQGNPVVAPPLQPAAPRKPFLSEQRRVPGWISQCALSRIADEAVFVEAGWPFPLFRGWIDLSYGVPVHHSVLTIRVGQSNVLMPTGPQYGRLLVAAYAFGTMAVVLSALWKHLRGHYRHRRGLCRRCAYPSGKHERCTECGLSL